MCLQEESFYGLVSDEAIQSPLNTLKVVELPFTKGCYYVAYCGGPGTFNSLVVDYYQSRPNELIQGHIVNVITWLPCVEAKIFNSFSYANCWGSGEKFRETTG